MNRNTPGDGSKKAEVKGSQTAIKKGCIILAVLAVCLGGLNIWTRMCENRARTAPKSKKVSIKELVEKSDWDAADYTMLREQTGLFQEALLYLKEAGRQEELYAFQEAYFQPVEVVCKSNTAIIREERVTDEQGYTVRGMVIPYIEEGDILITCCSHVFGWRNGHAALVVDADERLVLEAQVLGRPSVVTSLDYWEGYPSFMVLRLEGAGKEERAAIAAFAEENLLGVSYHLTAGILERLAGGEATLEKGDADAAEGEDVEAAPPSGTQCAHLIWYTYNAFGYDLDSDGGIIVTPKDIAGSDKLKIIQYYGIEL